MANPLYIIASVKSAFEAQDIDQNVYRKELVYPGAFVKKDPNTGDIEFNLEVDEQLMDHWVATFQRMTRNGVEVPLPIEHTTDPERRRGTVVDLKKEYNPDRGTNSLYAYVKFRDPKTAADLSKTSQVSLFAPPSFSDGKGNDYTRPITHVALTDYPLVPGLSGFDKAIAASMSGALSLAMDNGDEEQTMTPMQQLAADLGVDIGDETDDATIADMIRSAMEAEEAGEGDTGEELTEDPAVEPDGVGDDADTEFANVSADEFGDVTDGGDLGAPDFGDADAGLTNFADLAEAMGIDVGDETDEQAIAQMIIQAWNASEDDESSEGDEGDEEPSDTGDEEPDDEDTGEESESAMEFQPAAASLTVTNAIIRARRTELDSLVRQKKISPATRDELARRFATRRQVSFALSHAGHDGESGDDFDSVVQALSLNTPTFRTGSRTGAQVKRGEVGILEKDAERRAAEKRVN